MAAITLKVDQAQLNSRVTDYDNAKNKIKTCTTTMVNTISSISGGDWTGDARNAYVNKFRGLNDDISRMIAKLDKEIVQDLRTIIMEYNKAEQQNVQQANNLPNDIFT